ncbi:MAG: ABC transporter ATP-binding protein [Pseudoclavibacter sp.]
MSLTARRLDVHLDRHLVLSGVSVEVRPGEVLGLIGPNGAGKSTLLRAMAGLVRPAAGEIAVGGTPIASLPPRKRAERVAFVAQDTGVAADISALDLVMMGRYAHRRRVSRTVEADLALARDALGEVGLGNFAERPLPSLSGGERQLAQIARALAQRAEVLLLDEPTSALDVHHQLRIFAILRAQADAGIGVAVVLHDLGDAARYCDRIAVLSGGELVSTGTPREVLTPELIAAVYRVAAEVDVTRHGYSSIRPIGTHPTGTHPTGTHPTGTHPTGTCGDPDPARRPVPLAERHQ